MTALAIAVTAVASALAAPPAVLVGEGFLGFGAAEVRAAVGSSWTVLAEADANPRSALAAVQAAVSLSNTSSAAFAAVPNARYYQFEFTGVSDTELAAVPPGLAVANCHQSAVAIAEYVLASVLSITTDLRGMDRRMRACTWRSRPPGNTDCGAGSGGPKHRQITDGNLTLGILGYGKIGEQVALRAAAVGLRVVATTLDPPGGAPPAPLAWIGGDADNARLVRESDFLVIACPLTGGTRGLVGGALLGAAKPGMWLINVARGAIVEEAALWDALRGDVLGGAVLDVWWSDVFDLKPGGVGPASWPSRFDFATLDNVMMSPHSSSATLQTRGYSLACVVENLRRFAAGGLPELANVIRNASK